MVYGVIILGDRARKLPRRSRAAAGARLRADSRRPNLAGRADPLPITTGVCKRKHCSGKEDPWEDRPSERKIRGWKAVLPLCSRAKARLKGVCFTDIGITDTSY